MQNPKVKSNLTLELIAAIVALAILTNYPGRIVGEGAVGPASGRITIEGQPSSDQPKLPKAN
jgi:hypothetical protein